MESNTVGATAGHSNIYTRLLLMGAIFLLLFTSCSNADGGDEEQQRDSAERPTPAASVDAQENEETANETAGSQNEGSEATTAADENEVEETGSVGSGDAESGLVQAAPGKSMKVCLAGEAPAVFVFGEEMLPVLALRHAVSENLYTSTGYEYEAQGIEKVPSLADGDARRQVVEVVEGDQVVDIHGDVVSLRKGVTVTNAEGEAVDFAGDPVQMEQLEVDFTFQPMVWSDGTPLSSLDSVFSFNVAADPRTPASKSKTVFTESYKATGDLSVRWTGLPGFLDLTYFTNVWSPLPAHALNRYTIDELLVLEEVTKKPLSSGPYVVSEWSDENTVQLTPNPHYYRAGEGLPLVANLTIMFGDLETLLLEESECDVLAGGALGSHNLPELQEQGALDGWEVITSPGDVYEQIAYGVWPIFEIRESRPDWFGSAEVRQAIAMCTDRQRMADELAQGNGELLQTLTPGENPLAPEDLLTWDFDPLQGNAMLDAAGYKDYAGDGRRQDVASGVPMTVTLGTNSESALRLRIGEIFQENMADCGIPVVLYDRPAGTWFADGPAGPVFGRQFDLAALAWLGRVYPDCSSFTTDNIPGPEDLDFAGWRAPNVTGWSDEAYDAACRTAVHALPGGEGFEENMREALRIFNEQLPALPLFTNYKVVAVRPGVENVRPDATQPSELWNIAEWDIAE
ncbi:MAG: ABC transporter substrate-binding protein [Candidatus Promineifilaceae bacterium]